jgi:hypothetical protein
MFVVSRPATLPEAGEMAKDLSVRELVVLRRENTHPEKKDAGFSGVL